MRKLLYFLLFISQYAFAELPLSFTHQDNPSNIATGQVQTLQYVIRNNLSKTELPLKSISVINEGDSQSSDIISLHHTCGSSLKPLSSCGITVSINNPRGNVKRQLNINYGGRIPLTAPIAFQASQAAYTILIYIEGTDLESKWNSATYNIEQMRQIGSSSNTNIVITTGAAKKEGWQTVQRKLILPHHDYLLQDLQSVNMGLTSTIQDFFIWGINRFPANHYIAIFWDHGGGPNYGYGQDELHANTSTPINQLASAMKTVTQSTNKHFEIIGFDACFLGNVETFAGLYPYANYLVGSEDLEPGQGWQYTTFLQYVKNNPTANGLNIGTVIANGYTEQNAGDSTTLSVIRAASMPNLITAINQFSTALLPHVTTLQSIANWKQIARVRVRTPDYGTSILENKIYDVADLISFAKDMTTTYQGIDPAVSNAASAVTIAAKSAVQYYKNSPNRGSSLGLTIYFPSVLSQYVANYPSVTLLNGSSFFSISYTNLVQQYVNYYQNNTNALVAEVNTLTVDGSGVYRAVVTNDFEEAYAVAGNNACTNVLNNSGTPLGTVPCYTAFQFSGISAAPLSGNAWELSYPSRSYSSQWPFANSVPIILIALDTEPVIPNEISYLIPVRTVSGNENAYLSVVKNTDNEYEVVGLQGEAGPSSTQPKTVSIPNGTKFYVRTFAFSGGIWQLLPTTTQITAPFTISFRSLPPSFNAFHFLATDLTGRLNVSDTSAPYPA
jgi:hypothetical protein